MSERRTDSGAAYAVNVITAPVTVKAVMEDNSEQIIKVLDTVGQHTFIASSGLTKFEGGAIGWFSNPFDPARALGGDNGGAGNISPEAKAFLSFVTDGKLTFDADGRLKINASVDATGTFNHDGYASNYTKTVDGAKYTTTVNATEVIVKKSVAGVETVLMHLHDGVLELGGARVLTEAGERIFMQEAGSTAPIAMRHGTWHSIDSATTAVAVSPSSDTSHALSMQLMVSPTADMQLASGWLSATGGAQIIWMYRGEPDMSSASWTYIITLVQISPTQILANLSAILPRS